MNDAPAPPPPPPPAAPPPGPAPAGDSGSGGGVSENRPLMIVLSYLWLLALIPFLVEKEDREVQWHAKHGLVLLGAEIVLHIGLFMVSFVINMFTGCLGCFITLPVVLGQFIVHGLCIYKGLNGERFIIPGLSDFADRF